MQIERKRLKKPGLLLGVLIILLALLFLWQYVRKEMAQQFSKNSANQVSAVEVGIVTAEVWHPQVSAVGSIDAIQGIDVSAEISGKVSKLFFTSGSVVKSGSPLLQLDNSSLKADLANAQATYKLSQLHYQRLLHLQGSVSKESIDTAAAAMQEDKAKLDKAAVLLKQATIFAPFDGKVGLNKINVGQYVAAGDPMVSLQQIDPVYVDFDLGESYLSQVQVGDAIKVTVAAYPNEVFDGKLIATNSVLNPSTRTLNVRGQLPNPDYKLLPGMFADIEVMIPVDQNVLTVPEMAVNYSPFGDSVFKIVGDRVQQVYVKVGEQRGDRVAITGAIQPGEEIVTSGVFKLQNGSLIKIMNAPTIIKEQHPGTVPQINFHRDSTSATIVPQPHTDDQQSGNDE